MSKKVEIEIPFWGFYESIHDVNLEDAIESAFNYDYDTGDEIELGEDYENARWDADIDWKSLHEGYAKAFAEEFGQRFGLDLEFEELTSPQFYNFSTDRIFAKVPIEQINKIRKEVEAHEEYPDYIKERYTDRDGFWSNFPSDYKDEGWTKDELQPVQYQTILEFYIERIEIDEEWQTFLMDDFRGNGHLDELVNNAVEEIKKIMEENNAKK